jgi:hypothetical protein
MLFLLWQAARNQEQPMHIEALFAPRRSTLIRFVATAPLLTLAACSQWCDTRKPTPDKNAPRAQLSIGYSLLYQEADACSLLSVHCDTSDQIKRAKELLKSSGALDIAATSESAAAGAVDEKDRSEPSLPSGSRYASGGGNTTDPQEYERPHIYRGAQNLRPQKFG